MAFVQQLFDFVEGALAAGSSVLIHCLAGGTARARPAACCSCTRPDLAPTRYVLVDVFGTLHMTAMLGPHDLPTTSLTYFVTLRADQATRMAQAARPVINPIGGLPKLLRTFETDRRQ